MLITQPYPKTGMNPEISSHTSPLQDSPAKQATDSGMPRGYFITGTDTEVGKTWFSTRLITTLIETGNRVAGLKPVASGCTQTSNGLRNADAEAMLSASNVALDYSCANPYAFEAVIAPHIAAARQGVTIDPQVIRRCLDVAAEQADWVIVEGVGGWQVPLNDETDLSDLAWQLNLPVLLVVAMRLGCINHALLTANAIQARGATLAGWVANSPQPGMACYEENLATLKQRLPAPLIAEIPYHDKRSQTPPLSLNLELV